MRSYYKCSPSELQDQATSKVGVPGLAKILSILGSNPLHLTKPAQKKVMTQGHIKISLIQVSPIKIQSGSNEMVERK